MADTPSRRLRRFSYYGTLKGKVERAFRTVKDAYETLYHFHKPETEQQANAWLHRYLIHDYNLRQHRTEHHTSFRRLVSQFTHGRDS
jgi:FMN phosphatase YigB (HAD superfamily)